MSTILIYVISTVGVLSIAILLLAPGEGTAKHRLIIRVKQTD